MAPLIRTLATCLAQAAAAAFAVATVTFLAVHLASPQLAYDIAVARYGDGLMDAATIARIHAEEGLDRPLLVQYGLWLSRIARLDLGVSLVDGRPVWDVILAHSGVTLALAALALPLSLLAALPLGIAAGYAPGRTADLVGEGLSTLIVATPNFVIGAGLIWIFAIHWRVLPFVGGTAPVDLLLPAVTLALALAAVSSRVVAASVANVRATGYFLFAQWKGLSPARTLWRHGLRNMAAPVITCLGLQLAYLIEGAVVVETLFALPGIGRMMLAAVLARDVPVLQGTVILIALAYVAISAAVDAVNRRLAPGRDLEGPLG